jgi:peroxiredoxin Q/BCP
MATIPNAKRVKSTPADAPSARASSNKPTTNDARKRGAKPTDDAARKPNGAPRKRGAAGSVSASDTSSADRSTSAKSAKPKKASKSKPTAKKSAGKSASAAAPAPAKAGAKGKANAKGKGNFGNFGKSASAAVPAAAPAKAKGKAKGKGKSAAKSASAPAPAASKGAASKDAPKKGRFGRPLPTEAAPAKGGGKSKGKSAAKSASAPAPAAAPAKGGKAKGKSAAKSASAPAPAAKSSAKPGKSAPKSAKTASHTESKPSTQGKNGKSAKAKSGATDLSAYNQPSSATPKAPRKKKESGTSIAEASKQYTEAGYGGDSPAPKAGRASGRDKKRARPGVGAIANLAKAYTGETDNSADDAGGGDDETGGDTDDEDASRTRARRGAATGRTQIQATTARAGQPQPGDAAPPFSLVADDGETWTLEKLAGRRFVLYFYPKDDTPGCTRQACDFRDRFAALRSAGVQVLGVSSDSLASHAKFRAKYDLNFPLLSDPDRSTAQTYGVVGEKTLYGRTSIGVIRSTFVVGPDGHIEHVISPVKVDGHVARVAELTAE